MGKYHITVGEVAGLVHAVYKSFTADNEESTQGLAVMAENIRTWFDSPERKLTDSADACMDRFIDGELDSVTPGDQGPGRLTTQIPRFAARHRAIVSRMGESARTELGRLIKRHMVCGYLLAELANELSRGGEDLAPPKKLYEDLWMPWMYSPPFEVIPAEVDARQVANLWAGATLDALRAYLQEVEIGWQDTELAMTFMYFRGGMLLRILEAISPSKIEAMKAAEAAALERAYQARKAHPGS